MSNLLVRIVLLASSLALAPVAFAVKIKFESDPAGASIQIVGPAEALKRIKIPSGITPVELDLPRSNEPLQVVFSKNGFETVEATVGTRDGAKVVREALAPLVVDKQVTIKSQPEGAEVTIDGASVGVTPLTQTLRFERGSRRDPWKRFNIRIRKAEYQNEETVLNADPLAGAIPAVELTLARIAEDREIEVVVLDTQGKEIPRAEIFLNDAAAGHSDERGVGKVTMAFRRRDKNAAWPEFSLTTTVKNEYQPVTKKVAVSSPRRQEFRLNPVTEILVKRFAPGVEMGSRGPRILIDNSETIGVLSDVELNSPSTDLRPMTNIDRRQTTQSVNSFAITPDGKQLVFSITALNEEGEAYSNLHIKKIGTAAVTQLTKGKNFLDCYPSMALTGDEKSTLVVFQSNRSVPKTWNISAVRVEGGRVVGGVQQLTRESRFSFGPTIGSEQQPVFYTSLDETPGSSGLISSVRADGSTVTNFGEVGEMMHYTPANAGMLYLTRLEETSKKKQLYSVAVEGMVFSSVLNDEQFSKANCTWPALSPTSDLLLFVSDYAADDKGRKNNNIFLWDPRRGAVQQLTDNGSDDIMPKWSPTEPGVFYFLSNRQGAYNVWRMTFQLAQ